MTLTLTLTLTLTQVVFAANAKAGSAQARHWLHGFREVAPGSGAECQLCVVGLLE